MFCKKIFLISRFPGRILMCSARKFCFVAKLWCVLQEKLWKSHWNEHKHLLRGVLQTFLPSWHLQNRWCEEHPYWVLLSDVLPILLNFLSQGTKKNCVTFFFIRTKYIKTKKASVAKKLRACWEHIKAFRKKKKNIVFILQLWWRIFHKISRMSYHLHCFWGQQNTTKYDSNFSKIAPRERIFAFEK